MKVMELVVDSSFDAIFNAPMEKINLPDWVFSMPEAEYQGCSPAHVSAATTIGPDGRRMSINVEVIGGTPMVQHYQEELSEPHHLVLTSLTDLFAPTGRTVYYVRWELSVNAISENQCEFTNRVTTYATDDLMHNLERQGIPFELFKAQRQPVAIDHNRKETPFFAASLERSAKKA